MSYRAGVVTGALFTAACVAAGWALLRFTGNEAAGKPKEPALAPPATVATTLKEEQINTIVLSDEAVKRLALRTEPVTRSAVHRVRIVGGEVLTQPGHTIIVSAPVAAVLKAPDGKAPLPGQSVRRGQPMFELQPLLSPEGRANLAAARLEAEGQVRSADTNLDAATVALDRAKRVFAAEAGSRRAVDEAQAQFDLAVKALDIAKQRLQLLSQVVGEVESGTAGPIMVRSPCDGLLRDVLALPGQNVPSGASLFEVVDLSRVWVRVPVYVGDLPQVNADAPAAVGDLTARPGALPEEALPVSAPPSADPNAGTVDLFYELENVAGKYRPGERVGVALTLNTEATPLTVPWSAVLYDVHGGAWVYEVVGDRTFERRRVHVEYVVDGKAVCEYGPAEGAKVVTAGAAELFGTETGFTK